LTGAAGTVISWCAARFRTQPSPPLQGADDQERRQQGEIRVGQTDDFESCAPEPLVEQAPAVTPDFVAQHRMVAAQRVHRRDVDDRVPARLQHAMHFGDRGALILVLERINDVERRDEVEGAGWERHGGHAGSRHPRHPRLSRDRQADRGEIEAERAAEAIEPCEVGARSAAAVEDGRIRSSSRRAPDQRHDEGPQAAEPEMASLGQRGTAQQVLHRANSSVSGRSSCIDTARSSL
jgi:hypothetical protein